jgi:hypothetical protein
MDRPIEYQRAEIGSWTMQWLEAVARQSERVAAAPNTGAGQVEILLFVTALRNVIRGAEKILGGDHEAVRAFHQAVPGAKDVRDMLEHFDAYVGGQGRLQERNAPQWIVSYSPTVLGGGEQIIHINEDYTLAVADAAAAARPLAFAALEAASIRAVLHTTGGGNL